MTVPTPTSPKQAPSTIIELERACFGYGEEEIVHGVDLRITSGERVALLGPNGSGKSTLVRGLLGLNSHLSGRVELFGEPLANLTRRYRLGYVPQRHTLSDSVVATVAEVVATGRLPHQGIIARPNKHDRAIVAESLARVDMADFADHRVANLSGGQHRRVLIARALAAQPEVLIMDEPTAGVDAANQDALVEVLVALADEGVTQLIVTHEVTALAPLLSRVVAIKTGLVDFDGTPEEYRAHEWHISEWAEHHHGHSPETPPNPPITGLEKHR
ncbi:metal ABC transporter ATP-binding protein [Dermatophilus congolensis]|uniref:Glutamine transport ATP-binding protein GlnQ n=1 Tax=Dermatophilus congolensis TaxID=1863 RepID=A0A239V5T2_9MICO|nr:metal ABC transporter ATP-binding protein [Dermatophilus congolensis]MBO3130299.1 metal ABC transporter ATP-binding protein [Dermatophilus congolensis]MBO3131070.1 metal ABC transporter ATP-binding protein [Dermatophilus congolensis]MBO3134770.1 metal ABC transporter ATP-binding protein [Dermatophilus congolensis]MBO3137006.1 metal ABC transporter ATP-binding protein [Dermatophilus congolensis]MBO3139251.1 metal ABC transporter ATP-binding protein [Dermatophilus congolensis]